MFLETCTQIHSVVFALSRQINKQKYAKKFNILCAGNKVFVKYQAQGGGGVNHKTPCLRTPLTMRQLNRRRCVSTIPTTNKKLPDIFICQAKV